MPDLTVVAGIGADGRRVAEAEVATTVQGLS
jgi:hypothetical protein